MSLQDRLTDISGEIFSSEPGYALVLAGHGSRDNNGVDEFETLVKMMKRRYPERTIFHGFLEFARPTIAEAIEKAISAHARHIVVVPALLAAATHAKNDMPSQIVSLRHDFPDIEISFGSAMDAHPLLLKLCQERIVEAEASSTHIVSRADTCLVLVGRGTSDPDANAEIAKICRMLEEGMGFGHSIVCYSGTAKPLVSDALKVTTKLGCKRIIVMPYFLFDGVLVKRIYSAARALRERCDDVEVLQASYLGVHPYLVDVFMERADEGINGKANMNCSLCKYRVQIVGFESQVGAPQRSHHASADVLSIQSERHNQRDQVINPYEPHPIEAQSMEIINAEFDWSRYQSDDKAVLQRLVHTTGDFSVVDDIFFSPGVVQLGLKALLRCRQIITDVTMVESGLKRSLLDVLKINVWCGVHERESHLLSQKSGITRSAAGIRRAWEIFGNDAVVVIGDAPTAVMECTRLIKEHAWRPQMVVGLPVGFVGTIEAKENLMSCMQIPRITNRGTRGGSPWAATVTNALMIMAVNKLASIKV
jgi:precorrin-8X/cobalt-precorrin-8 methylmutase